MTSDASEPDPHDGDAPAPGRLEVLGRLAELDTQLDQISHRVEHLPERAEHADATAQSEALARQASALDARIAQAQRRQRSHEDTAALIEAKRERNSRRLYDGQLTSPKEAAALTAEAEALARRQTEVEDQILEVMEELEPLTGDRAQLALRQSDAAERAERLAAAIAEQEQAAKSERAAVGSEREALAASADPALIDIYEQRRAAARSTPAVGRLIGTTCGACRLELPSADYERIVHLGGDELPECPQCGALLVR